MTELNEAVEKAVDECIQEGVLADFLLKNRTEAIEMCILEYDEEREIKLIRKAEYEDGREAGLLEGTKKTPELSDPQKNSKRENGGSDRSGAGNGSFCH